MTQTIEVVKETSPSVDQWYTRHVYLIIFRLTRSILFILKYFSHDMNGVSCIFAAIVLLNSTKLYMKSLTFAIHAQDIKI